VFYGAVHLILNVLQDIEYLIGNAATIGEFIASPAGNAVILVGGIFLIVWAVLSGPPGVVARAENPGPVSISEGEPYVIDPPKYPTHGYPVTCLAPYNDRDAATAVEIEGTQSEYDVVVSYDVRSVTDEFSAAHYTMSMEARIWVVGENGERVRNLDCYRGRIDVAKDGSWQHAVSGRSAFVGLPKGVYSLYVVDSTAMDGWRGYPQREYRDMYLRVTRR
jgi:hypothetical protein